MQVLKNELNFGFRKIERRILVKWDSDSVPKTVIENLDNALKAFGIKDWTFSILDTAADRVDFDFLASHTPVPAVEIKCSTASLLDGEKFLEIIKSNLECVAKGEIV